MLPALGLDYNLAYPYFRGKYGLYGVAEWPAAGLRSTLHDILVFLQELTSPNPSTLLPSKLLSQMFPDHFRGGLAWWGRDAVYGERGDLEVWSHGGFMEGVRSHIYFWPKAKAGLVLMQNCEDPYTEVVERIKTDLDLSK